VPGIVFLAVFLLPVILSPYCYSPQTVYAACGDFKDLIRTGSYALADTEGRIVSSCNPDTPFIPASILKIQTALAALQILGSGFRFQTDFFMDNAQNLYIRGAGDPLLTSEEVLRILGELRDRGVQEINGIFIDTSLYALPGTVPGGGVSDNPFDSPVTAAGVNFNTISIRVDNGGEIASAEPQTPTLPIMMEMGRKLPQGTYRLNICLRGCVPEERAARYTGELFRGLQKREKIPGGGQLGVTKVPAEARLVYRHDSSKDLKQVVASFLEYSSNYVANQVFLACGAKKYGYPATWDKAGKAVREALENILGPEAAAINTLYEGSGLSRRNSTTASVMIRTLAAFRPYQDLLQEREGNRIKSGTLEGVYNYAGYLRDGKLFVIMLNQLQNTRDAALHRLEKLKVGEPEEPERGTPNAEH